LLIDLETIVNRHLILLYAVLLGITAVAGLVCLVYFSGQPQMQPPMFVIHNDNRPSDAMAVFPDPAILKKHNVSAEQFEVAFRADYDAFNKAIAGILYDMFSSESSDKKQNPQDNPPENFQLRFGFPLEAFQEILETSRVECWTIHSDGSHTVTTELPPQKNMSQKNGSALVKGKSSEATTPRKETTWSISVPPTTLEEAKKTFAKDTGIVWPDSAHDVRYDEKRMPLLGDGEFYIGFAVPGELLKAWIEALPPWDAKQWSQGPIPVEIGSNCGFGFECPRSENKDGLQEYSGGATEILEILKSKEVRYVARDRGPVDQPWYNGDLLILDSRTGVIRYGSWDR
jgi:hypothetical protein